MSVRYDLAQAKQEVKQLFVNLMALPALCDAFYHVDQVGEDGATYRIFTYRLANYSAWLHPGAMEARGIMFRLDPTGDDHVLVSRSMEKFFNWNENPFTMNIDLTKIQYAMVKEDGSLISSYTDATGQIRLKTKGSLRSEQAVAAEAWMNHSNQKHFRKVINGLEHAGWTVNMEWTSPLNRIVVSYQEDKLIILNVRHRETGVYMEREAMEIHFAEYLVPISDLMVEDVAAAVGTEGIVAFFGNDAEPRFMKVKADAYLVLHRLKDGVNQPNALFEAVMMEQVDDLRASFAADPAVQLMIAIMEELVHQPYNQFLKDVTKMYEDHKHLDKKNFAITVQAVLKESNIPYAQSIFGAAISLYIGRPAHFHDVFMKAAQARIVGEYKVKVVQALSEQNFSSGNLDIQ